MEGTAHEGEALDYVSITPTDYEASREYPVIILVHGFGASMYDLAGLSPGISQTDYVYLCPNGIVPFDIGGGQVGFGWTTPGGFNDEAESQRAEDAFEAFMNEVSAPYKVQPGKTLVVGFSQGGGIAYRYGLTRDRRCSRVSPLSARHWLNRISCCRDCLISRRNLSSLGTGTRIPLFPWITGRMPARCWSRGGMAIARTTSTPARGTRSHRQSYVTWRRGSPAFFHLQPPGCLRVGLFCRDGSGLLHE